MCDVTTCRLRKLNSQRTMGYLNRCLSIIFHCHDVLYDISLTQKQNWDSNREVISPLLGTGARIIERWKSSKVSFAELRRRLSPITQSLSHFSVVCDFVNSLKSFSQNKYFKGIKHDLEDIDKIFYRLTG